jgi:hypothetical protein
LPWFHFAPGIIGVLFAVVGGMHSQRKTKGDKGNDKNGFWHSGDSFIFAEHEFN